MNNNGTYIIPANSKKSQLFLSYFNAKDLIVLAIGIGTTIIGLATVKSPPFMVMVGLAAPALIAIFLVLPLAPHYHNIMTLIGNMNRYLFGIKKYYWRGWCASYGDRTKDRK
jgi:hypothetical protein